MRGIDLINVVREYPEVYDPRLDSYKDFRRKAAAWKAIASQVQENEVECRRRWKTIRDKFVRERKKIASFKNSGADCSGYRLWPLMNSLMFLNDVAAHRIEIEQPEEWSSENIEHETSNSETLKSDEICQVSIILPDFESNAQEEVYTATVSDQIVEGEVGTSSNHEADLTAAIESISTSPIVELTEMTSTEIRLDCNSPTSTTTPSDNRKRKLDPGEDVQAGDKLPKWDAEHLDQDDLYLLSIKDYFKSLDDKSKSLAKIKILEVLHNLLYE